MGKVCDQLFTDTDNENFQEIFCESVVEEIPEKEYNEPEEFGDDANKTGDLPPF